MALRRINQHRPLEPSTRAAKHGCGQWDNPSTVPDSCHDALVVRKCGKQYAIAELTKPVWEGTEIDAWQILQLLQS
ncbi:MULTISPECIES: DUF6882 domain-containing protein [Trichocoleus]|uniref:DUF6882 domain-containing protein n=1 Tax=Trichocoleus TaxID=450526 RepID=UPI001687DCEC|nr:DUF6882 domain-containing protein [Trichocoleus sp. FACHB-46]